MKKFLFILMLVLLTKASFTTNHYVCTDSVFFMNSGTTTNKCLVDNVLNDGDKIYLMNGAHITVIPDTLGPSIYWVSYPFTSCDGESWPNMTPLYTNKEGRYCHNSAYKSIKFEFTIYEVDSTSMKFELVKKNTGNDEYTLQIKPLFTSYLWSTGGTISSIVITEPGLYWLTVWDYCGNEFYKEIYVDLEAEVSAGVFDPATMTMDIIIDTTTDWGGTLFSSQYYFDIDKDGINDIHYNHSMQRSTSHIEEDFRIRSFNDYHICSDFATDLVNVIDSADEIDIKQNWVTEQYVTVKHYKWGTNALCGDCTAGYTHSNTLPSYIGIKKEVEENNLYGWMARSSNEIQIAMQTDPLGTIEEDRKCIKVYPNPAQNRIFISSKSKEIDELSIYTIAGHCVLKKSLFNNSVDVSRLGSGMYIMHIIADDSRIVQKLVIQR